MSDDLREKIEALGAEYGYPEVERALREARSRAARGVSFPETVSPEDMKTVAQGGRYPSNG